MTALLDPREVTELYGRCLAENSAEGVAVEGIMHSAAFSPGALEKKAAEITAMLAELPPPFFRDTGGGWTFLNACTDRNGELWTGEHEVVERLLMLGMAIGKVRPVLPREDWEFLPGGMPYYVIDR